jgi:protein gp37
MAAATGIEWTDATWNPVRGCSRVSEGCRNCYAERVAARFSGPGMPYEGLADLSRSGSKWTGKVAMASEAAILQPLRWKRPRRIFVNSMSDLFHDGFSGDQIMRVFAVMALAQQHCFQVLTKRPDRMRAFVTKHLSDLKGWCYQNMIETALGPSYSDFSEIKTEALGDAFAPIHNNHGVLPNVWLGVSVEDQATADARIPILLDTPAAVRFISAEPLLGRIDLDSAWCGYSALDSECWGDCRWCVAAGGEHSPLHNCRLWRQSNADFDRGRSGLDWVIVGGESGPGARPMHLDWARSIRDQCAAAGVPLFVKQLSGSHGKAIKDIAAFPADLQLRQFPHHAAR